MKKLLVFIIWLFVFPFFVQGNEQVSEFHRLLIFNAENQLMVVKIKNTNFWVTPGLYSKNNSETDEFINKSLHELASEFGLTITAPDLRGLFILKNKQSNNDFKRYFYQVNVRSMKSKLPDNIEEIKWLPLNEAMDLITFPHINMLIDQIMKNSAVVWTGTILRYKKGQELKAKMVEDFFPLKR